MSLIPEFEIGLWNAWILMAWYVVVSISFMLNKKVKKRQVIKNIFVRNKSKKETRRS